MLYIYPGEGNCAKPAYIWSHWADGNLELLRSCTNAITDLNAAGITVISWGRKYKSLKIIHNY